MSTAHGVPFETPLFVPSFSSRGFGADSKGKSEVADALDFAGPMINDALLVSAYDIHYEHIPGLKELAEFPVKGPLGSPDLLFVDSGGYETRDSYDLSEVFRQPTEPKEWSLERLDEVVSSFSPEAPLAVVNFDQPGPYGEQIAAARSFFKNHASFTKDFLVKPHSLEARYLNISDLTPLIPELSHFDIIGVTEKELGNKVLDRLETLALLRLGMDRAGVQAPIHVFGSLDPLISPLYFVAGAEIFDGLSWLRYAYRDGLAIYGEALSVLELQLDQDEATRKSARLIANLDVLRRLAVALRASILGAGIDFTKLGRYSDLYQDVYDALRTRVEGR